MRKPAKRNYKAWAMPEPSLPTDSELWAYVKLADLPADLVRAWLRWMGMLTRKPANWKSSLAAYVRKQGLYKP